MRIEHFGHFLYCIFIIVFFFNIPMILNACVNCKVHASNHTCKHVSTVKYLPLIILVSMCQL